jgi:hypothetical protein
MADLPISGRCLCGGIRFEISEPLVSAGYCHCTRCQRRTGTAASVQARIPPGALRTLSGEQLLRAYAPGDGGFDKLFCSVCGSAMFSRNRERPELMSVRLGVLDADPEVEMTGASTWPTPRPGSRSPTMAYPATKRHDRPGVKKGPRCWWRIGPRPGCRRGLGCDRR